MADVSLYWFRDDLRLSDLPGLTAAAQAGPIGGPAAGAGGLGGVAGAGRWLVTAAGAEPAEAWPESAELLQSGNPNGPCMPMPYA